MYQKKSHGRSSSRTPEKHKFVVDSRFAFDDNVFFSNRLAGAGGVTGSEGKMGEGLCY